jgi:dTDP-4-amino-4,6-dideoxygalactose transaminase
VTEARAFIPIAKVSVTEEEIAEVTRVLRSGWLTTGKKSREFEDRFREYVGAKHALALNSGTAALHLAASALGLGPGDEMITSPLTFAATVNCALFVGATPVLADVDARTLNLSPAAVEAAITPRTRAIALVHMGGLPCDMEAFQALARKHDLQIIEDACHAVGATYGGKRIGSTSRAACFSFHPVKNMTTGEGGMLVTDDDGVEKLARLRSWHGIDKSALARYETGGSWYYEVQDLGFKYNITDIASVLGIGQLARIEAINAERREIAAQFDAAFARIEGLRVAPRLADRESSHHLYWVVLDPAAYDRDKFIAALATRQIGSGVHYIPIHHHPYYQRRFGWQRGLCPVAERAFEGVVSLPLWQGMSASERARVIEGVPAALAESRR